MKIKVDDIPVQFHAMVEIVGIDKFVEVTKLYGGTNTYIPTYKGIFRYARNREIVKQFNGVNYNELAIRYNMCVGNIKRILNENSI
ncbi:MULTISPECIES: Mor transcription activator family protein [unclassified Clostridioides]|uniref:Mor transcription activator family protein n=1 Tax=unclassified Clostridioides TaxID=2635829 RepID=UPI001D126A1E|nr:transcriptional regulator [Clostridioides sp. ES-S-0056-01]MCC0713866.1 transcriptional regulator [Clostridioides sp. ES-S-0077-01]